MIRKSKIVTIVIVSYNTKHLLPACLDSIKRQDYQGTVNVVVVDTGNDNTKTLFQGKKYDWVKYIAHPQNDGFGRANNLGMKTVPISDYYLILNPDTELQKDTLSVMVKYMEQNPDTGITTCRVELPDGSLDKACKRGFPTPWASLTYYSRLSRIFPTSALFNQYHLGHLDEIKENEIDACVGAFMLVRADAIKGNQNYEEVGMFDEQFWANGEDLDWCYRFKCAGWKVVYVPTTKIIHYKGASSGTQISSQDVTKADVETKRKWINAFYDAMPIFYRKHYQKKYPFFVKWIVFLGVEIKRRIALKKLLST